MIRSDTEFDLALVFISYGSVFRDIAEGLAKKGLKVIVFAPDRDYKNPDNTYSSEQASENLRIERIPVPRLDKNDLLQKLLFFLFFSRRTTRKLSEIRAKLYISTLMPVLVPYEVFKQSEKNRASFILMLEDLVPDTWIRRKRFSKNNLLVRFFGRQTRVLMDGSDKIIVIGRDMQEYIQREYKVPSERIAFIPNWSKLSEEETHKFPEENERPFVVLYGGTIGEAQNLVPLIHAAEMIMETDQEIEFQIIGSGMRQKELQEIVTDRGITNIRFFDLQPPEEYARSMDRASLLVVSLRNESKGMSVPSKTYSCLAQGKPILAMVPEGSEVHLEIQEDGYGVFCPPDSPKEIAEAIIRLKNDKALYAECSRKAFNAHKLKYNDKTALDQYYRIVTETLNAKNGV